jgi:hypothetical protein
MIAIPICVLLIRTLDIMIVGYMSQILMLEIGDKTKMISDVLSQAVVDLDRYLIDPDFDHIYIGETRERLIRLRDEVRDLQSLLDTSPVSIPAAHDRSDQTGSAQSELVARMMADETAFEIATPAFSRSDLLKRGWTKSLIQLLGPPDWTTENPHGPGFAQMQCYRRDRVVSVEASLAFPPSRKIRDEGVVAPK